MNLLAVDFDTPRAPSPRVTLNRNTAILIVHKKSQLAARSKPPL